MPTKTARKATEGEDILGLVAFGSLISNIFQLASKKNLEQQHEALKAYTLELKRHYGNMVVRERQVSSKCLELKRANEELVAMNNRLLKEMMSAVTTGGNTARVSRKRRYVQAKGGETK